MRVVVALSVILGLLVVGIWGWKRGRAPEAAAMGSLAGALAGTNVERVDSDGATVQTPPEERDSVARADEGGPSSFQPDAVDATADAKSILEQFRREAPPLRKIDHTLSHGELRTLAMDLSLSIDERIEAAKLLRYGWKGDDPRGGAVAAALIDLVAYADGEQRGHIWKALDECEDPQLVEPMLQALLHDPDAGARSEAAESLGTFIGEPRVRTALQKAADTDPDDHVRKEARGSLDD